MRAEDTLQAQQSHLSEGMPLIFNQESSLTPRSSRSTSRSSSSSSSSSSDRSSFSNSDRSRSQSVSHRSRRCHRHGSRYSSSSSSRSSRSRSRSHPRCCRASDHSRCRHRCQSGSYSPYPRRSYRYGRQKYSRSISRSSSRERYYRRSRRSRSRSSSYRRTRAAYTDRFRCRFSPSPLRRSYSPRSKSPERSLRLSQKDKMELLNIARENAAKILGVEVVKLPASVKCIEEQMKKSQASDTEKWVRADPVPVKKPSQDESEVNEDVEISRTSPARKPIIFSISNVAKPSSSPTLHSTESKVTSRADSVGNGMPYGKWIPVKTVSTKKR